MMVRDRRPPPFSLLIVCFKDFVHCDVSLRSRDRTGGWESLPCHSSILAALSPVLRTALAEHAKEEEVVVVSEVEGNALLSLLYTALCCYTNVKWEIKNLSLITSIAPIFLQFNYFRQNLEQNFTFTFYFFSFASNFPCKVL